MAVFVLNTRNRRLQPCNRPQLPPNYPHIQARSHLGGHRLVGPQYRLGGLVYSLCPPFLPPVDSSNCDPIRGPSSGTSSQPSSHPTTLPSSLPSGQPTAAPSSSSSCSLSSHPSCLSPQPSEVPSGTASEVPSRKPSGLPPAANPRDNQHSLPVSLLLLAQVDIPVSSRRHVRFSFGYSDCQPIWRTQQRSI